MGERNNQSTEFAVPDREPVFSRELTFARDTAAQAGELLLEHFGRLNSSQLHYKGKRDLVTDVDREVERLIRARLEREFPGDPVLGEELSSDEKSRERIWLIDPLDGTTNYYHGIPFFAVAIAFMIDRRVEAGVVYLPYLGETFYAERMKGAFLNGARICVSRADRLIESVLATGFPYRREELEENNLEYFNRFFYSLRGIRRIGTAAMDLSYVACGRLDGFWEVHLGPWDVAAASLIVTEAGGMVTDFSGGDDYIFSGHIAASNGRIHGNILKILRGEEASTDQPATS